ncbi:Mitochodrial transcription termination factor-related protein [Cynara cardunculus var. scolymus]|uniref:Mitochodrial transcription termination factor-related protein n=1 Tax=Cynara cardunculus var. scolymus TaxID=59895 RepID=A0A103XQE1_CYNCS|nr:Mitochodrial transcription termination factor-related protein [Cynara cardunculus var. scolymus]
MECLNTLQNIPEAIETAELVYFNRIPHQSRIPHFLIVSSVCHLPFFHPTICLLPTSAAISTTSQSEFTGMGFTPNEIREEIIRNPKILGSEVGEMSKCLRMLNSLKCRVPIKENLFSEGAFMASYEVKSRIDCLHKHGLLYRDAFSVLWREPRAILYDLKEIDLKMEFLTNTMKFDVLSLDEVPEYLGVHFEKQIVPRYNVIEHLRSKGGIGDEIGLRRMIMINILKDDVVMRRIIR